MTKIALFFILMLLFTCVVIRDSDNVEIHQGINKPNSPTDLGPDFEINVNGRELKADSTLHRLKTDSIE